MKRKVYTNFKCFKICYFWLFILLATILSVSKLFPQPQNYYDLVEIWNKKLRDQPKSKWQEEYTRFCRLKWFLQPRVNVDGVFPVEARWREWERLRNRFDFSVDKAEWENMGPNNCSGRILDIVRDPINDQLIYAASASGGVWRRDNGIWYPLTDFLPNLTATAIVLRKDNPDILYIGTGEVCGTQGTQNGIGIIKVDLSSESYEYTAVGPNGLGPMKFDLPSERKIYCLVADPNDPDIMLAGTRKGIFKTIDGWVTAEAVAPPDPNNSYKYCKDYFNFTDVVVDPLNPQILYASFHGTYSGKNYNGIWKSNSYGDLGTWDHVLTLSGSNRIELAIAPSNTNVLYACAARDDGGLEGIYKSTDAGKNWSKLPFNYGKKLFGHNQGNYDNAITVYPKDEDIVFVGGIDIWRSKDGGNTWTRISGCENNPPKFTDENGHVHENAYVHPDIHNLRFIKQNNGYVLYAATDGGVFRSYDYLNDYPTWEEINNDLITTQFYDIKVDNTAISRIYGGTQDNGTWRLDDSGWKEIYGNDGGYCEVNYNKQNIVYWESQGGWIRKSEDYGANSKSIVDETNIGGNGAWVTPIVIHPTNPDIVYSATDKLWKYDGNDWVAPNPNPIDGTNKIISIAVTKGATNIIYVATESKNGHVFKSVDYGSNWKGPLTGLPSQACTRVVVDQHDDTGNTIYATFGGYETGAGHVFKSTDGGDHWTDITNNLPDVPVNDIDIDPIFSKILYVATDLGVFRTENEGASWATFMKGLPAVITTDLEAPNSGFIYAGTYGRGVFRSPMFRALADLTFNTDNEWSMAIIPRNSSNEGPVPDILYSPTYITLYIKNKGGELAGHFRVGLGVNDWSPMKHTDFQNLPVDLGASWETKVDMKGGRHTLLGSIDYLDEVLEASEANNFAFEQFIWEPKALQKEIPEQYGSPPKPYKPIEFDYPNCDGFQYEPSVWPAAIAVAPMNKNSGMHIGIYDYSNSSSGFEEPLISEKSYNGNIAFVGATSASSALYCGIYLLKSAEPQPDYYIVEASDAEDRLISSIGLEEKTYQNQIDKGHLLHVYNVYLSKDVKYSFEFTNESSANLGMNLYSPQNKLFNKDNWEIGANNNGAGADEKFAYQCKKTGNYTLVIYKNDIDDYFTGAQYTLKIRRLLTSENISVWKGTDSSDWFDSNNWSDGKVPDENTDVFIPQDVLNIIEVLPPLPPDTTVFQCRNLFIEHGGELKLTGHPANKIIIHGNFINHGLLSCSQDVSIFCRGNWQNSGMFRGSKSAVILDGENPQIIYSGSFPGDLLIKNSASIIGNVNVAGSLQINRELSAADAQILVGESIEIGTKGYLKLFGQKTKLVSDFLEINRHGYIEVTSDSASIYTTGRGGVRLSGDIILQGTLDCAKSLATDIHCIGNWKFSVDTLGNNTFRPGMSNVYFEGSKNQQIYATLNADNFYNLIIAKNGGYLTINENIDTLRVNELKLRSGFMKLNCNTLELFGNLEIGGQLSLSSGYKKIIAHEDVIWKPGCTANLDNCEFYCDKNWYIERGSRAKMTGNCTIYFVGNNPSIIKCESSDFFFQNIIINKLHDNYVWLSRESTAPLQIYGTIHIARGSYFFANTNQKIRVNQWLNEGAFYPGLCTVEMSGRSPVILDNAGFFRNLVINTQDTVYLKSDIQLFGDFQLNSGQFDLKIHKVYVKGDWVDNVKGGGLVSRNGCIIFNGEEQQFIGSERFRTMIVDKPYILHPEGEGNSSLENIINICLKNKKFDFPEMLVEKSSKKRENRTKTENEDITSIYVNGDVFVTDTLLIKSGQLCLPQNTIKSGNMSHKGVIIIGNSGSLLAGSGSMICAQDTSQRFQFLVNGSVSLNGLQFCFADSNGMLIDDSAFVSLMDSVRFLHAKLGGRHITYLADNNAVFRNCYFDASFGIDIGHNVLLNNRNASLTFVNCIGEGAGPEYSYSIAGNIYWQEITDVNDNNLQLSMESKDVPTSFYLQQNYPNPFNAITKIKFGLPRTAPISVKIFDQLGREVVKLIDGIERAGHYQVAWNADQMPSGVYFVCLEATDFRAIRKIVLLK